MQTFSECCSIYCNLNPRFAVTHCWHDCSCPPPLSQPSVADKSHGVVGICATALSCHHPASIVFLSLLFKLKNLKMVLCFYFDFYLRVGVILSSNIFWIHLAWKQKSAYNWWCTPPLLPPPLPLPWSGVDYGSTFSLPLALMPHCCCLLFWVILSFSIFNWKLENVKSISDQVKMLYLLPFFHANAKIVGWWCMVIDGDNCEFLVRVVSNSGGWWWRELEEVCF